MKLSIVAALLILFGASALARTVTVTGQNGGSAVSTGRCQVDRAASNVRRTRSPPGHTAAMPCVTAPQP